MHSTPPSARTRARPLAIALLVAFAAVVLDQGTKTLALLNLSETECIPVLGDLFGLQLAFNPGTVMSLGADTTWIITIIATAACIALIIAATRVQTTGYVISIGLVLGGAIGNLLDRLLAPPGFGIGHVTDFLAYGTLFIGNIADIILGVGVGLGVLTYLQQTKASASMARTVTDNNPPEL